ncbi:MAG TPA: fumarylacetoacetate hydrolase family protein [Hyphomicrobiales bacterium]|nr:fumarylacetoacetate hydrolase family protein [Hyphomicrobiales bacterium]
MKLVTYEIATVAGRFRRLGVLADGDERGRIVDVTAAFAAHLATGTDEPTPRELAALRAPPDMIGWLRARHAGVAAAAAALAFVRANPDARGLDGERLVFARDEVRLLAPLPRPASLRDFSIYEEHMSRAEITPMTSNGAGYVKGPAWYRTPPFNKGSCAAICGPEDPVPFPYYTKLLDLEIEVGIIVGREGRNLSVEDAADHIAGYTILVDSSCRDGYEREPFGPTKRKDFHTALGPALVTPDEVDVENLACSVTVDGETWFEGTTAAPHSFTPAQLVAFASDNETLHPGDLIGTGTIGLGCSMDHHRWIRPGQVATFAIEGLGAMSLKVVEGERVVSHVLGMNGLLSHPSSTGAAVPA